MATANESQGLKIAVAAFVSLTVILAVTSYFLYTNYDEASKKLEDANSKLQAKTTAADTALREYLALRDRAGYKEYTAATDVMAKIEEDQKGLGTKLGTMNDALNQAVTAAQNAGASAEEIARLRENIGQVITRFSEPASPTFKQSLDDLADLINNQVALNLAFTQDNVRLRSDLVAANQVNKEALGVQETAARKTGDDLKNEVSKHEEDRNSLVARVDQLQTGNSQLSSENALLKTQMAQLNEDHNRALEDLRNQLRSWRTLAEKKDIILDVADGLVTFVDYGRREVRVNVNRSQGARPQMTLTVFDKDAPGLPTDRPKGRIELIQVGERDSVARVLETIRPSDPIRIGDQIYSAAWSPGEPQRFALVGKIDMNRDGRDDRANLIRLIRAAGGVIEYDLPPPVIGPEKGELTARSAWYVIDEREPIRNPGNRRAINQLTKAEEDFNERKTEAIRKAASLGVRPLTIERLLSSLGYSPGMAIPGTVEASNPRAMQEILNPRGLTAPLPSDDAAEEGDAPEGEENNP